MRRRLVWLTGLVALLVLGPAGAAFADPAGPTHFRSTATQIETADGEDPGIGLEIVGGDAYLVLDARGRSVAVPGYEGEPYLRFDADGSVWVNERSPARWLNDARFGSLEVEVPVGASADAPPEWRMVSRGGVWSWHDHRIHFMSPSLPAQVDPTAGTVQAVTSWEVPLTVDDDEVVVRGELDWVPGPSTLVSAIWGGLAALGAVGLLLAGASRAPAVTGVAALVTGASGAAATWTMPAGADVEPALLVLPGVALVILAVGRWWARQGDPRAEWVVTGAGVPIGIWGVVQIGALTRPIVPGPLPVAAVRPIVAVALAVGVGTVLLLGRRVVLATRVDPDADA
ncbi:MAG: hypothetical protein JJT89_02410 [Nitriliruptoraceae bacterium]|nr:hypothetical protein [Nitriliruptoraceae bacterium]